MYHIKRNAEGALDRVETFAFSDATEILSDEHPEIRGWVARERIESAIEQLRQSDIEMIRVLDDLIQLLTDTGVIRITDLPQAARDKLLQRIRVRESLEVSKGGLGKLLGDDERLT